jgi:toxin HigB-1
MHDIAAADHYMVRGCRRCPTSWRRSESLARPAKRRLEAINAAHRIEDLLVPPSNRLEKLKGNLKGFFSIRVNDQWRVIFK